LIVEAKAVTAAERLAKFSDPNRAANCGPRATVWLMHRDALFNITCRQY